MVPPSPCLDATWFKAYLLFSLNGWMMFCFYNQQMEEQFKILIVLSHYLEVC